MFSISDTKHWEHIGPLIVNQGRGDALLGKVLLCESEDLSWDPQDQHKKQGTYNPGTRVGDKQVPRSSLVFPVKLNRKQLIRERPPSQRSKAEDSDEERHLHHLAAPYKEKHNMAGELWLTNLRPKSYQRKQKFCTAKSNLVSK